MTHCPECGGPLRLQVSLFLEIPAELAHRLSKGNLRRKDVKVLGAGWPSATYLCFCGWTLKLSDRSDG